MFQLDLCQNNRKENLKPDPVLLIASVLLICQYFYAIFNGPRMHKGKTSDPAERKKFCNA
jgi:hypothetical protein